MKTAMILTLAALAACTDPTLNAGITIGAGGMAVTPSISGRAGGATITVSH